MGRIQRMKSSSEGEILRSISFLTELITTHWNISSVQAIQQDPMWKMLCMQSEVTRKYYSTLANPSRRLLREAQTP